jgi:hypothetical protein
MIVLNYYPDTDTLDVAFRASGGHSTETYDMKQTALEVAREIVREPTEQSQEGETETYEANPSGQTLAHYKEDRLSGLTIEHASRRAPAVWGIESLRREAADVAATTGRVVESVTYDLLRDRTSFQTGELGPQSPYTSDAAVQEFNQMIETTSAAT